MRRTILAATGASAGGSLQTGVVLLNTENVGDNYLAYGVVTSDRGKCRGDRRCRC
jgi:hypothetical protein